jgi:metal-responsive CopG/Arc/MetJ family transcriptional regulator
MRETITVSVPKSIKQRLDWIIEEKHLNRSEIIQEALRQYFARQEFRRLRQLMVPEAESRGIYTDEDVFRIVS